MPPKDEELFVATDIYMNGQKITTIDSLGINPEETENLYQSKVFTISGKMELSWDVIKTLFTPKDHEHMVCTKIDGLEYTFSNSKEKLKIKLKEMTEDFKKIEVGMKYDIKYGQTANILLPNT